jgi:hypothetical protein
MIAEIGLPTVNLMYEQPARKFGITKNNWYTLYDIRMLGGSSATPRCRCGAARPGLWAQVFRSSSVLFTVAKTGVLVAIQHRIGARCWSASSSSHRCDCCFWE